MLIMNSGILKILFESISHSISNFEKYKLNTKMIKIEPKKYLFLIFKNLSIYFKFAFLNYAISDFKIRNQLVQDFKSRTAEGSR